MKRAHGQVACGPMTSDHGSSSPRPNEAAGSGDADVRGPVTSSYAERSRRPAASTRCACRISASHLGRGPFTVPSSLRARGLSLALALSALALARVASAQDGPSPSPQPAGSPATPPGSAKPAPAPTAPSPPATSASLAPLPAPSAGPSPRCTLGRHDGIDEADAQTVLALVCDEATQRRVAGSVEVRMHKLGGHVFLSVTSSSDSRRDERHARLSRIEEAPTAAARIADALANDKPLAETENVHNVLAQDAAAPEVKRGRLGVTLGILGVSSTRGTSPSPGLAVGLAYSADRFGVGADLRFSGKHDNTYAALATGGRYHFSDGDVAPFAGVGIAWSGAKFEGAAGSGFGTYAEAGVDGLRTHKVGFVASLRLEAPLYALDEKPSVAGGTQAAQTSTYVMPVMGVVGLRFR